jgi:uncharacterized glyoxalase superfamily protein PhnB
MGSPVITCLRYDDAPKAIEWLCEAFGFEKHFIVPGEEGKIAHAQLRFRDGMIMLGSAGAHGEFDSFVKTPKELGGVGSMSIFVVVPDADVVEARAVAAGAEIIMPLTDQGYGGRGFGCTDLEGNVWSFGSYDPWHEE